VRADQISSKLGWLDTQCYDVDAKPEGDTGLSYEKVMAVYAAVAGEEVLAGVSSREQRSKRLCAGHREDSTQAAAW